MHRLIIILSLFLSTLSVPYAQLDQTLPHGIWPTPDTHMTFGEIKADPEFYQKKLDYIEGELLSDEIIRLAKEHALKGMPFQGAKILERSMNAGQVPKTGDNLFLIARLYESARERETAMRILEKAIELSPTLEIAEAYIRVSLHVDACESANSVISKNLYTPKDSERFELAQCFEYKSGRTKFDCKTAPESKITQGHIDLNAAKEHYSKIDVSSELYNKASVSVRRTVSAIKDHTCLCDPWCGYSNVRKELCFIDIQKAYKTVLSSQDKLVLKEEKCRRYLDEYITIYR